MSTTFDTTTIPSLHSKVIFITGGTAGLGRETIFSLAAHDPAHIYFSGRSESSATALIAELAKAPKFQSPKDVPFSILLPAYATSELKTAFQIGFLVFLPFLIIDLIVASALMSLGMMMLSPTIISMPFKLLLFVLVDGWALTMGSLAASFAGV